MLLFSIFALAQFSTIVFAAPIEPAAHDDESWADHVKEVYKPLLAGMLSSGAVAMLFSEKVNVLETMGKAGLNVLAFMELLHVLEWIEKKFSKKRGQESTMSAVSTTTAQSTPTTGCCPGCQSTAACSNIPGEKNVNAQEAEAVNSEITSNPKPFITF